jgi:hypothetical protein
MENNLLKNWELKRVGDVVVAWGNIYNDVKGRFKDGTYIHTSRIVVADLERGLIQTKNSVYKLEYVSNKEN